MEIDVKVCDVNSLIVFNLISANNALINKKYSNLADVWQRTQKASEVDFYLCRKSRSNKLTESFNFM